MSHEKQKKTDEKPKNMWTEQDIQKLVQNVDNMKKQGNKKIWVEIGKQFPGKSASQCFNKYTQVVDSKTQWTDDEQQILANYYSQCDQELRINNKHLERLQKLLPIHSQRAIQFKLEQLSQKGKLKVKYQIGKQEMQRYE